MKSIIADILHRKIASRWLGIMSLLWAILSMSACSSSGFKLSELVPINFSVQSKNPGSVHVAASVSTKPKSGDPVGGTLQMPGLASAWLKVLRVTDISTAISDAVLNAGLFASVKHEAQADYTLKVHVMELAFENKVGWTDSEAKIISNWEIIRRLDNETLADYKIIARDKATFSEIFNGNERYRVAVARALNQTIRNGIEELPKQESYVKLIRIQNMTDQEQLAKIATGDTIPVVRKNAAAKLLDQEILAKIAVEDNAQTVRKVAVERVTDQNILVELEKTMWSKAEKIKTDVDHYQEYLDKFPNNLHSSEARDCVDWSIAERRGPKGIRAYLEVHPRSRFALHGQGILKSSGQVDKEMNDRIWENVRAVAASEGRRQSVYFRDYVNNSMSGIIKTDSATLFYSGAVKENSLVKRYNGSTFETVQIDNGSTFGVAGTVYELYEGDWFPVFDRFFKTKKSQDKP